MDWFHLHEKKKDKCNKNAFKMPMFQKTPCQQGQALTKEMVKIIFFNDYTFYTQFYKVEPQPGDHTERACRITSQQMPGVNYIIPTLTKT